MVELSRKRTMDSEASRWARLVKVLSKPGKWCRALIASAVRLEHQTRVYVVNKDHGHCSCEECEERRGRSNIPG